MLRFEHLDVLDPLSRLANRDAAGHLLAGAVLDLPVLTPAQCTGLVEEVLHLQRCRFDPAEQSYTEFLVAEEEASLGWGTADAHGKDLIELPPLLGRVVAALDALCEPLRAPGERRLFSITPSIRRARSFPRFYHQDSPHRPHAYRLVWDLGLERSSDVLNVHFIPSEQLEDDEGQILPDHAHLFQRAEFTDHYELTDAEIEARQPQVREDSLPTPDDQYALQNGRVLAWLDPLFYHSTYLRAGRHLDDLRSQGRSIMLLREIIGHRSPGLPDDAELGRLLGFPHHSA